MTNPICTFFINNNCRFGNQCKKEHIDVRLIVKTDIDGVIKGSQWPLSVYGPFKDKPNVPHFIEDQSFEELRAAAYDAKSKGTFPAYATEVAQRFADAKHRMGQLYELNMETVRVIVEMYNGSTDSSSTTSFGRPNNPFTKVNNNPMSTTASNAFGAKPNNPFASTASNSMFGNNSASTGSSSVFGSEAAGGSSNIFGASPSVFGGGGGVGGSSSVFGGDASTQSFGASSTASNSIFAQPNPAPAVSSNNIFGNTPFGASAGSSVFGAAATFPSQPASIFGGGSAAPPAAAPSGSSMFGQPSSVFGGSTASNNVFGSTPNPIPVASSTNIFGQQQSSFFGAPPTHQNAFANASVFGTSAATQQTTSNNIFGQQPTSDAIIPNNHPFGAQPAQPTNVFGASSGAQQTSAFGVPVQSDGGAFGNNYQSPFAASQPPQPNSVFGNQLSFGMVTVDPNEASFYSQREMLSAEELAAFSADTFDLATIPSRPPPREMCA